MTVATHKAWLLVTGIGIAVFGPIFSLGTVEATSDLARWSLDLLNGPGGSPATFAEDTTRFLTAPTGGFLFGWGVMVLCLRAWVFDATPDGVRRSVLVGLCAWFVLDSIGSVASGNPWNVGFNVLVLLVLAGPLWRRAVVD